MQLIEELYNHSYEKAQNTRVECLSIGLRYTAVTTDDGGMGIAFTYIENNTCCAMGKGYRDYEGQPAIELLTEIKSSNPFRRSMALALINALNYQKANDCLDDTTDRTWMDTFNIGQGTRVAMVGFFRPLMNMFNDRGATVEALDEFQGVGERDKFYEKLSGWADVLLLTSTSILNDSTEDVLAQLAPGVKVVMIGPSTPMMAEAFRHLPVHVLAGTVPVDKERVLKAVRHGMGTPVIHRFSRKVYTLLA